VSISDEGAKCINHNPDYELRDFSLNTTGFEQLHREIKNVFLLRVVQILRKNQLLHILDFGGYGRSIRVQGTGEGIVAHFDQDLADLLAPAVVLQGLIRVVLRRSLRLSEVVHAHLDCAYGLVLAGAKGASKHRDKN
jgi:hypothetical protein